MRGIRWRTAFVLVATCLIGERASGQQPAGSQPKPARKKAVSPAPIPEHVILERDVVYGRAGDRPLHLDLLRPKAPREKATPVIVFIHGGGWRAGNKSAGIDRLVPFVATGRYLGATIEYRLSQEALFPAQIHDCKAAIRWLRANADKYGLDPGRIGAWGPSAGGHLVALLGTSGDVPLLEGDNGSPGYSSSVSCVVDFCGPTDFPAFTGGDAARPNSAVRHLFGAPPREKPDLAKRASPVTHVSANDPPFLIVHGTHDDTVPFDQAERLDAALKNAGVAVTLVRIEGGGHGIGGPEVLQRVTAFFDKHLLGGAVEVAGTPIKAGPQPERGAAAPKKLGKGGQSPISDW